MNGHRGYYEDGWEVVTLHHPLTPFGDDEWELYDLTTDPVELHDRSADRARAARPDGRGRGSARPGPTRSTPSTRAARSSTCVRPERSEVYRRAGAHRGRHARRLERWRSVQLIWFRVGDHHGRARLRGRRPGHARGPRRPGQRLRPLRARRRAVVRAQRRPRSPAPAVGRDACPAAPGAIDAHLDAVGGGTWTVTLAVDGERARPARGRAAALRHGAVRGHRRGHRPAVAGELGAVRAVRPLPLDRAAAAVTYTPGRRRPGLARPTCSTSSARWGCASSIAARDVAVPRTRRRG